MKGSEMMKRKNYRHYNNCFYLDNKIPIKLKKAKVSRYFIEYRKAKNKLEFFDVISSNEENDKEKLTKYVLYIDKVIDLLSKEAKPFIINEYIKNYNNSSWWTKTYNRSTYYKIRKAALDEFLNYVE